MRAEVAGGCVGKALGLIPVLLALVVLAGCERSEPTAGGEQGSVQAPQTEPLDNASTLAWVGGEPVTRAELDLALERVGDSRGSIPASEWADLEGRLLASLVDARALALLAERGMSPEELEHLGLQVRAYREELLVKHYLAGEAKPKPVGWQMVQDYYRGHPKAFGGGREVSFELVRASEPANDADRDRLIVALSGLGSVEDWETWTHDRAGTLFGYRSSVARPELLEQPLRGLVEGTAAGSVSAISRGDLLMRVRVTSVREIPPKPLVEVAAEIRRRLAPLQLRETVRELAAKAVAEVGVRYAEERAGP